MALFRQATRERLFAVLERVVPQGLPLLRLNGLTPAQVGSWVDEAAALVAGAVGEAQHTGGGGYGGWRW